MLSLGMEGGSKRRHRVSKSSTAKKAKKPKRRSVVRRAYKKTKRALKKVKKMNKSLLKLISPKKLYN